MPMVLKAAVQLGVLEIIQRAGPGALLSLSQIASQVPNFRIKLLDSHSILTFSLETKNQEDGRVVRLYGLAPVAKYFIRNPDGGSLATLLDLYQDRAFIDIWAHGMSAVEYVGKEASFGEIFKGSMIDYNNMFVEEM
ncbi:hypothetical protein CRYUN_Cryun12cG0068500 [Craigia yunnanensis]